MLRDTKSILLPLVAILATACAAEVSESPEDEVWDEGPPPGEEGTEEIEDIEEGVEEDWEAGADGGVAEEEETAVLASELHNAPRFELPFPCGQVWRGQTRYGHSPRLAIDFNRAGDLGDLVVAAARGRVTRVENEGHRSYGRWIEIGHGNGYRTRYAHLRRQLVTVGQRVRKGQRIGRVGSTGGSSGAHLHYELRRHDRVLRPVFHGRTAYFWGERKYRSRNCR